MTSQYFPLPEDYLDIWQKREKFELCIVGKDPYPRNPIGIPFCKPTWQEFDYRTSGRYVLRSLGIDPEQPLATDPRKVFLQLAEEGIGFLNATYSFLGRSFAKGLHQPLVIRDSSTNLPFLQKSRRILLCGEAGKLSWLLRDASFDPSMREQLLGVLDRAEKVPHPDIRNRSHPKRSALWHNYWGDNALEEYRQKSTAKV